MSFENQSEPIEACPIPEKTVDLSVSFDELSFSELNQEKEKARTDMVSSTMETIDQIRTIPDAQVT